MPVVISGPPRWVIYVAAVIVIAVMAFQSWAILSLINASQEEREFRADVRSLILCGNDQTCIESVINRLKARQPAPASSNTPATTSATTNTGAPSTTSKIVSTPTTRAGPRGPQGPSGPQGPPGSSPTPTTPPTTAPPPPQPPPPITLPTLPCIKGVNC